MRRGRRSSRCTSTARRESSTGSVLPSCVRSGASSTAGGRTSLSTAATSRSCSSRARTSASTATRRPPAGSPSAHKGWRDRMILFDELVGEGLPLVDLVGRDDDPLAERLAAAGRVEQMRSRNGQRPRVRCRIGELEHHSRAREAADDSPATLQAGHAEDSRRAHVWVPRRQRIDDVVVAITLGMLSVSHESSETIGITRKLGQTSHAERELAGGRLCRPGGQARELRCSSEKEGKRGGTTGSPTLGDVVVAITPWTLHGSDVVDVVALEEGDVRLGARGPVRRQLASVFDESARSMDVQHPRERVADVPETMDDVRRRDDEGTRRREGDPVADLELELALEDVERVALQLVEVEV